MSIPVTEHVKAALLAESNALEKDSYAWDLLADAYEIEDIEDTHNAYLNALLTGASEAMRNESKQIKVYVKKEKIPNYENQKLKNAREQLKGSKNVRKHAEEMVEFWEEKLDEAWMFEKEKKRRIRAFNKSVRAYEKSEKAWKEAIKSWEEVIETSESVD